MRSTTYRLFLSLFAVFTFLTPPGDVYSQIERKLSDPSGPVDNIFLASNIVVMPSVANLPAGNVNFTILHVFGKLNRGPGNLWGLDDAANIRFGLDAGVTDWLSLGIGRSRFDKLYDFRAKATLLHQRKDNSVPVQISLFGDVGIDTETAGLEFDDKLSYYASVLLASKITKAISFQIAPSISHFNTVVVESPGSPDELIPENTHLAVAIGGRFLLSERIAVLLEYVPVVGNRTSGTKDVFAVAFNLETGGHVFQLFLKSSNWLTSQHVIARNTDDFFGGDIRFGFNVNRVFGLN